MTRLILEQLAQASPPAWLLAMIEHQRRTGTYRPRDLRRLLGNINESVTAPSDESFGSDLLAEFNRDA